MSDWRNIRNGSEIPTVNYCDQPYVASLHNGAWLCALTTADGHEGAVGEFVGVTLSHDRGATWGELRPLEDPQGPESCYSVPFVTPSGRVYIFYNYNGDNFRASSRSDELGWFVFRYSDDHGVNWSDRHRVPMRLTRCDRENTFGGRVQLFWCVSHAVSVDGAVYIAFSKMKTYVQEDNEGWVFRSPNLLTEADPCKLEWDLLPEGDDGIRNDALGSVQEEHNIVPLSDGSLYCMYRTATGHPAFSISRDGARSWSLPEPARDVQGRLIKTPRACPMMWRTRAGRFLFWFHNNGTPQWGGRNPVWLCGGIERNGTIAWSQPEIFLYDPDPSLGMSYPDMIEEDGQFTFFHTQKSIARSIRVDPCFIETLCRPAVDPQQATRGLRLDVHGAGLNAASVPLSFCPDLSKGQGLTLDLSVCFERLVPGDIVLDNQNASGAGFRVSVAAGGRLRLDLADGHQTCAWESDLELLDAGRVHHVAFVIDGGPKVISVVVDGRLGDGGTERAYGWCHMPPELGPINASGGVRLAPNLHGKLLRFRVYDRYLLTSELVGNHAAVQRQTI